MAYILQPIVWVYLHSNFSGGLCKTFFSATVHFSRSRSSQVVYFGTIESLVCFVQQLQTRTKESMPNGTVQPHLLGDARVYTR